MNASTNRETFGGSLSRLIGEKKHDIESAAKLLKTHPQILYITTREILIPGADTRRDWLKSLKGDPSLADLAPEPSDALFSEDMTVIDSTKKTFGEELTAVRKVRMGRSSLAEASGISLSLISQVESGKIATPLFKTIYPLISALGLSMGDPEYDQLLVPGMRDNWAKYKDNYSSDLILDRRSMELKMLRLFLNYRPEYLITEGHINLSPRAIYEAEEKTRLTQKHAVQIYKALGLAQEAKRYPWGNNPYFALSEDPSANRKYGRPKKQITVDKKEEVITEPNNNDEILNLIVTRAKDNPTLTATLTLSGGRKMVIDDISDSTIESVIGRLINPLGRND